MFVLDLVPLVQCLWSRPLVPAIRFVAGGLSPLFVFSYTYLMLLVLGGCVDRGRQPL